MACVLIVIGCAIGKLRVRYCRDRDRDVTALLETVTKIFFFFFYKLLFRWKELKDKCRLSITYQSLTLLKQTFVVFDIVADRPERQKNIVSLFSHINTAISQYVPLLIYGQETLPQTTL